MVPTPANHPGYKEASTEEMHTDWTDFQTKRQQDALESFLLLSNSKFVYLLFLYSMSQVYFNGHSWFVFVLYLVFVPGRFGAPFLRRWVRAQPTFYGVVLQLVLLVVSLAYCLIIPTSMESSLMQHRCFLTTAPLLTVLVIFVSDMPFWVHAWMVAPVCFWTWLTFHWYVGFLQASMAVCGLFLVILQTYLSKWVRELRWQQFQASEKLDRERQTRQATQETLRCMLSSVWDASCTCNADGDISSSTPHLELLLGGGQDLVGSCLYSFAADEAGARRLQDFLQKTESFGHLQCTIQPQRLGSSHHSHAGEPHTCEAKIHAIRLPSAGAFGRCSPAQGRQDLFIGVRANWPEASIPYAASVASHHTSSHVGSMARSSSDSCISWNPQSLEVRNTFLQFPLGGASGRRRPSSAPPSLSKARSCHSAGHSADDAASIVGSLLSENTDWTFPSQPSYKRPLAPTLNLERTPMWQAGIDAERQVTEATQQGTQRRVLSLEDSMPGPEQPHLFLSQPHLIFSRSSEAEATDDAALRELNDRISKLQRRKQHYKSLREIGKKQMPEDEAKYKVIEAELQSLYDERRSRKSPEVQRASAEAHLKKSTEKLKAVQIDCSKLYEKIAWLQTEKLQAAPSYHSEINEKIAQLQAQGPAKLQVVSALQEVAQKAEVSLQELYSKIGTGLGTTPEVSKEAATSLEHVKAEIKDDDLTETDEASEEFSHQVVVKTGCSTPGKPLPARLSDILKMRQNGTRTLGSNHGDLRQCAPCSFHFSYTHHPESRPPCRASYLCEYCHDAAHFPTWRSSLRKRRKCKVQPEDSNRR